MSQVVLVNQKTHLQKYECPLIFLDNASAKSSGLLATGYLSKKLGSKISTRLTDSFFSAIRGQGYNRCRRRWEVLC